MKKAILQTLIASAMMHTMMPSANRRTDSDGNTAGDGLNKAFKPQPYKPSKKDLKRKKQKS